MAGALAGTGAALVVLGFIGVSYAGMIHNGSRARGLALGAAMVMLGWLFIGAAHRLARWRRRW
jgi:hypothetical protein